MRRSGLPAALLIVLLCSSMAYALPLRSWGFKGGYTSAVQIWQHDWISNEAISRRSGIHLCAYAEWFDREFHASFDESHHLSVITGLNYEQKGMGYTISNARDQYNRQLKDRTVYSRLDYLSVPIMAKYCVRGKRSAPYLVAGPRLDISLGSKDTFGLEDEFRDVVFGLSAGVGFEVSPLGLFFEFVYNYDPFWLWEAKNELTGNGIRVKNESFNISMGVGMQ